MQGNFTTSAAAGKPQKPRPDFPLTPHPNGRWCKKIAGQVRYFGSWEDPEGALHDFQIFMKGKALIEEKARNAKHIVKPKKPYSEYPLTAHNNGKWCKKIRGRFYYFGPWADPDGALQKYLDQKDDLHAGRTPRADSQEVRVKDVCNAFLASKDQLVEAGELSPLTRLQYGRMSDEVVSHFGKHRLVTDIGPTEFDKLRDKFAKKWGPHLLKKAIQYVRSIFKHAYESGLIERPIRFGPGFKRPSAKTMRLHRAKQGKKLLAADEIRAILDRAVGQFKAMIFLGINCGFGNADCAKLPFSALNLETGWVDFPRPKTGIARRCYLWPETVSALKESIADRPEPKEAENARLVFITKYGQPWTADNYGSAITHEMQKVLHELKINGRVGLGFYTLRTTYRTVGDEVKDQAACDHTMGHEVPHMSAIYRQAISDDRLKTVAEHVRKWLFG
jgi:integrase